MEYHMETVSVVCCYNNDNILNTMLEESVDRQNNVTVERLYYNGEFKSAAEAYNYAIDHSQSEYLVFVHQDIKFVEDDFLYQMVEIIKKNPDAIYGLCGATIINGSTVTFSNVYHGLQNKNIGKSINAVTGVQGLDEIFVAFHRDVTKKIQFDPETFDGWHIFVQDICMKAHQLNIPVYVMPLPAQHKNSLEMPRYMMIYNLYPSEYFKYLKRLRNKYCGTQSQIVCPCFTTSTKAIVFWPKVLIKEIKTKLHRWMRIRSMR